MCLGLGSDTLSLLYLLLRGQKTPAKSPSLCPWLSLLLVPYFLHPPAMLYAGLKSLNALGEGLVRITSDHCVWALKILGTVREDHRPFTPLPLNCFYFNQIHHRIEGKTSMQFLWESFKSYPLK